MSRVAFARAAVAAAVFGAFGAAQAADYVLAASAWGPAQAAAVAAAGGTVKFSHGSGLATVASDNFGFLAAARASGAFTVAALDRVVQQAPVRTVEAEALENAVTFPVTDTFYPFIQWAPQSVGAPAAWAAGYTGKGVRVAVIDGGIFGTHPDLAVNIDTAAARSFVTSGAPGLGGCSPTAWNCDTGTFWHGTHVSGIIAAPANGLGVVGIAPEATIVPAKALHGGSGSFESVIRAILYAADGGRADIINMSLGAVFGRNEEGAGELIAALNQAVNYAGSKGVLVISSAGNDSLDVDHTGNLIVTPAQNGSGLAVSATGPFGFAYGNRDFARFSSYSNYGNSLVNVAAPGGDFAWPTNENCTLPRANGTGVTIPCWAFDMVLSTSRAGWSWAAGTSMAAPAAAAVAALIKQKNPNISVGALKNKLMNSAIDFGKVGHDPFYGRGYISAARAVAN